MLQKVQEDGPTRAVAIACGVYGSYFIFYSGYKKGNAKNTGEGSSKLAQSFNGHFEYTGSDLHKMVSSPGSEGANIQLNKVVALAGLTLAGMAALPPCMVWKGMPDTRKITLQLGTGSLVCHVAYSLVHYYKLFRGPAVPASLSQPGLGLDLTKLAAADAKPALGYERVAIIAGSAGMALYAAAAFEMGPVAAAVDASLTGSNGADVLATAGILGLTHFYFMETSSGTPKDLPVRPWGYMGFIVPSVAVGIWAAHKIQKMLR